MGALLLQVFTHRHGLAARLGHDLRLSVADARLRLDGDRVEIHVPLAELQVDGAMRSGRLDPTALSASDQQSILRAMRDEVLETARQPEAVFRGTASVEGDRVSVRGDLTLKGRTVALEVGLRKQGSRLEGLVALRPSLWGIRPYSAMGGVLKVTDEVEVRAELALDPIAPWPPQRLE